MPGLIDDLELHEIAKALSIIEVEHTHDLWELDQEINQSRRLLPLTHWNRNIYSTSSRDMFVWKAEDAVGAFVVNGTWKADAAFKYSSHGTLLRGLCSKSDR